MEATATVDTVVMDTTAMVDTLVAEMAVMVDIQAEMVGVPHTAVLTAS